MIKITCLVFTLGIANTVAIAKNSDDVLNEIVGACQFGNVFSIASKEVSRYGNLTAALLAPAVFGFDSTSSSVGLSMANAELKTLVSQHTNNMLFIHSAPIIADAMASLVARAMGFGGAALLLSKKAGYALSDVTLAVTGSNITAAVASIGVGVIVILSGGETLGLVLCENGGVFIGDAAYAMSTLYGGNLTTITMAATILGTLLFWGTAHAAIAAFGPVSLAIISGFALSSYLVLLQSIETLEVH